MLILVLAELADFAITQKRNNFDSDSFRILGIFSFIASIFRGDFFCVPLISKRVKSHMIMKKR